MASKNKIPPIALIYIWLGDSLAFNYFTTKAKPKGKNWEFYGIAVGLQLPDNPKNEHRRISDETRPKNNHVVRAHDGQYFKIKMAVNIGDAI